ncbi:MAG TPA: ferritin-like domain-containing protein [Polyangiaceae bacterium]
MTTTYAEIGLNRTGIATSPALAEEMIEGTSEFPPGADGDETVIAHTREDYAKISDPLGTVPPPTKLRDAAVTAMRGLRGLRPTQFLDKLGERLAFERTGVRLYEALISKLDAFGGFPGGPSRAELQEILREEFEHFRLLTEAVTKVGGDPTVVTPAADLHATMNRGVLEVVVDPRTTFAQCLEAALMAELADNEGWQALTELASQTGETELAARFEAAKEEEDEHLENVRSWLAAAQNRPE